jgi:ribonuclease VapC
MAEVVLDSSAVIALLRGEPGSDLVMNYVDRAVISAVNLQEVAKKYVDAGIAIPQIRELLDTLHLDVRSHTAADALAAAALAGATRVHGRGLGDRSCMALAIKLGIPAVTTDRAWAKLEIPGLRVMLAR